MRYKPHFFLAFAVLCLAMSAVAGNLYQGVASTVAEKKVAPFVKILVVSADKLNDPPHNNSNPPRGMFTVHECLRGHVGASKVELGWMVRSNEADHMPWTSDMPVTWQQFYWERPGTDEWSRRSLPAPPMGERIIVFAVETHRPMSCEAKQTKGWNHIREIRKNISASERLPYFEVREVFAFTDSNREIIRRSAGPADRDPRIQRLLARVFISCTFACLILFGVAFGSPPRRRVFLWIATIGVALLSVLVWGLFESGNVTGGIRIDLFIIFPMLGINLLAAFAAVVAIVINRKRAPTHRPHLQDNPRGRGSS